MTDTPLKKTLYPRPLVIIEYIIALETLHLVDIIYIVRNHSINRHKTLFSLLSESQIDELLWARSNKCRR